MNSLKKSSEYKLQLAASVSYFACLCVLASLREPATCRMGAISRQAKSLKGSQRRNRTLLLQPEG